MLISSTKTMIKSSTISAFEEGAVGHQPGQTEANILIGRKETASEQGKYVSGGKKHQREHQAGRHGATVGGMLSNGGDEHKGYLGSHIFKPCDALVMKTKKEGVKDTSSISGLCDGWRCHSLR